MRKVAWVWSFRDRLAEGITHAFGVTLNVKN